MKLCMNYQTKIKKKSNKDLTSIQTKRRLFHSYFFCGGCWSFIFSRFFFHDCWTYIKTQYINYCEHVLLVVNWTSFVRQISSTNWLDCCRWAGNCMLLKSMNYQPYHAARVCRKTIIKHWKHVHTAFHATE